MEEQERIEGTEDVEGHARKKLMASDEPTDETESEVEAHRKKAQLMASEEPSDDDESDDVEAHGLRHRPQNL